MSAGDQVPGLSSGFREDTPEPAPVPGQPVRILRDVQLRYLSLGLWPGPYGSIPRASRGSSMPGTEDGQ